MTPSTSYCDAGKVQNLRGEGHNTTWRATCRFCPQIFEVKARTPQSVMFDLEAHIAGHHRIERGVSFDMRDTETAA